MNARNSSSLKVKDFSFMKVLPNNENLEDIMLFTGLNPQNLEQEKICHLGGSPYMIGKNELTDEYDNAYVIRWCDGRSELVHSWRFKEYFEDAAAKEIIYPKLMPKSLIAWIVGVERYHQVNKLLSLSYDASIDEIKSAYEEDRYTLIGIGEELMEQAKANVDFG